MTVDIKDFEKLELKVGEILRVDDMKRATEVLSEAGVRVATGEEIQQI